MFVCLKIHILFVVAEKVKVKVKVKELAQNVFMFESHLLFVVAEKVKVKE